MLSPCWTTSSWAWNRCKNGFLQKQEAREKVLALSEQYGLQVDPDALVEDITVGMQQRTEILKMLYRDNEILIFDEPTAVLTPQEIDELMQIMQEPGGGGQVHPVHLPQAERDHGRGGPLHGPAQGQIHRHGEHRRRPAVKSCPRMMVGRDVEFAVHKEPAKPEDPILEVEGMTVASQAP